MRFVSLGVQEHLREKGNIFPLDPHHVIFQTCATFFLFEDLADHGNHHGQKYPPPTVDQKMQAGKNQRDHQSQQVQSLFERFPFLRYAGRYWPSHQKLVAEAQAAEVAIELHYNNDMAAFVFSMYYATHFPRLKALPRLITGQTPLDKAIDLARDMVSDQAIGVFLLLPQSGVSAEA